MAGRPLRRFSPGCDSVNRKGAKCGCLMVFKMKNGSHRCRFHGGLSTGPKTPEGKARIVAAAFENLKKTPSWRKHLGQHQ